MTIVDCIQYHATTTPNKLAVQCDGSTYSYQELQDTIVAYQQKLTSLLGNVTNKKIAFMLPNNLDFITLFCAISASGAIAIPLDPKGSDKNVLDILQDCEPDLLLHSGVRIRNSSNEMAFEQFLQTKETSFPPNVVESTELFYIGYTSGTTGQPKGYMRSHGSWEDSFLSSNEAFKITSKDRVCSPGPLVHSHFLYAAVHALHVGATLYITEKFNATILLEMIEMEEITVLYLVPTMFAAIEKTEIASFPSLKKIISAGAKWHKAAKDKAAHYFPEAVVYEFYGASELSFVSFLDDIGYQHKPDSVGKAFPGVEVSIRKEDGSEANYGEIGTLFVRSKQLFSGYLNLDKETRKVFVEDWATVGDLAMIDEDGYITLVGRHHNKIISGGLNLFPEEVEMVLLQRPEIDEAIVLGLQDPYWGEIVTAVITFQAGRSVGDKELTAFCKAHLASYKVPKKFIVVRSFPYTTSGKINRKAVRTFIEEA
ncbi:AMP-binding protein [Alkalihalobacterium alkalicellulosilyticum]|uniref:AMP-binding protein n=1 Tax=Alkalihalobacterium alkalicellulosilyticum TaxID=1912214 RepID=UPI0011162887|nr:AMP-binding protein [Bacillus alkalicellulosilyticus]